MPLSIPVFEDDSQLDAIEPALSEKDLEKTYKVVCSGDDSVVEANKENKGAITLYSLTSDGRQLKPSPGADVFEIRCVDIEAIDEIARRRTPAEELLSNIAIWNDSKDALNDEMREMFHRGRAVEIRRAEAIVRRGLVSWSSHPKMKPSEGMFPEKAVKALFNHGVGPELARHIMNVSTLAPFGLASFVIQSGDDQ